MNTKTLLTEQIEREREFLAEQEVGDEEYVKSLKRLMELESHLSDLEKTETEVVLKQQEATENRKDRIIKNALEGIKVGGGIILPLIGLVWITATEKDTTFTGALKEYTRYFLPKKM